MTLRSAVMLLFEIVCELFEAEWPIAIGSMGSDAEASIAEWKRLEAHCGADVVNACVKPDALAKIADTLRSDLQLSVEDLRV